MIVGILIFVVVPVLIMLFAISFSKWLGEVIFGKNQEEYTFVNKSVHYHTHNHEHKNISIIDDTAKNKILDLKEINQINQFKNNNCPYCKYFQTKVFKKKIEECDKCKKIEMS